MNNSENLAQLVGSLIGCVIVVAVAIAALFFLRTFIRRLQNGTGPLGSVIQQNRELAQQRLQVERELLAAQQQTNELLKQVLSRLDQKT